MRAQYYWDTELSEMEKSGMTHQEAALKIAGYDAENNDETFECNCCGETLPITVMAEPVVRGDVPVLCCLNCVDQEALPAV